MSLSRMSKIIGGKGLYFSLCKSLKINPIRTSVPIFGEISTYHEILNLHDNFAVGELRDEKVEGYLRNETAPLVIDCGVNVGITVRWWLHGIANAALKVVGVDMMEEAHQFTIDALKTSGTNSDRYRDCCAALWKTSGEKFSVSLDDPLFGENSLYPNKATGKKREVFSKTLDDLFSENMPSKVSLLKIDLEGAGSAALEGAEKILQVTKHLVFEIHGEKECKSSTKLLSNHGFYLRKISNRHLWWERD